MTGRGMCMGPLEPESQLRLPMSNERAPVGRRVRRAAPKGAVRGLGGHPTSTCETFGDLLRQLAADAVAGSECQPAFSSAAGSSER